MTNRQKYLLNANEYDLLINIQKYMRTSNFPCVIDAIVNKEGKIDKKLVRQCNGMECEECIQKWLNEEEYCGTV